MRKYLIILTSIFAFSFTSNDKTNMKAVNFDVISKGVLGGAGKEGITKQNLIITDKENWTSLKHKMDSVNKVSDYFSEKNIDFSKYTIIALFEGVKNNGGYKLDANITTDSKTVFVEVVASAPGPYENVTTAITQPYYIVKILNTDLPIVFNRNDSQRLIFRRILDFVYKNIIEIEG